MGGRISKQDVTASSKRYLELHSEGGFRYTTKPTPHAIMAAGQYVKAYQCVGLPMPTKNQIVWLFFDKDVRDQFRRTIETLKGENLA